MGLSFKPRACSVSCIMASRAASTMMPRSWMSIPATEPSTAPMAAMATPPPMIARFMALDDSYSCRPSGTPQRKVHTVLEALIIWIRLTPMKR